MRLAHGGRRQMRASKLPMTDIMQKFDGAGDLLGNDQPFTFDHDPRAIDCQRKFIAGQARLRIWNLR
jgi:hypothetical protein